MMIRAFQQRRAFATGVSLLSSPPLRDTNGKTVDPRELFKNKRVVVFGVVGAFTGTCSNAHVPSFVKLAPELKKRGINQIVCVTVNDHFVAKAWQQQAKFSDDILLLTDADASFTRALNLDIDLSGAGLGVRSKRYSMLVDNGVVVQENIAANPRDVENTGAETILATLK